MRAPPLPHTARCACPRAGGCGRLIPVGTCICHVCQQYGPAACGPLHYGDQALQGAEDARARAEGRLLFLRSIALDVERTGGVASWRALLAAASGDWPEELQ